MVRERDPEARAASDADPLWPAELWHALTHEWRAYVSAVVGMTRTPRRFAAEWADGARAALNPALCALNAAALIGGWTLACHRVLDRRPDLELPLWAEALKPIMVFVEVLFAVLPAHAALRLVGVRRPLRTTVGVMLYAFSGPIALVGLISAAITPFLERHAFTAGHWRALFWSEQALMTVVMIGYATAALAGASRVRATSACGAVVLMFVMVELARHALLHVAPTLFHLLV